MFRFLLVSLAIVACAATPSYAIVVDGGISDWVSAGLLQTDTISDHGGAVDITRYGATIDQGVFYAVIECTLPSNQLGTELFAGAFINSDGSTSTELLDVKTNYPGTDINLEWGLGAAEGTGSDPDYSFWGESDSIKNVVLGGVTGGAHAISDSEVTPGVIEWSAPVSTITSAIAALPDSASTAGPWEVVLGAQCNVAWGYDYSDVTLTVNVPEPGTLTLTILAALGAFAYAWRKRS